MPDLTQKDHFASAAKRHFCDADYLHGDGRLPAADHLFGFAAECAIKSLLLRFTDVTMGPTKPMVEHPEDPDKKVEFGHVNELVREVRILARGRNGAQLHTALVEDLQAFKKWHVKFRYFDGGYAQSEVVSRRRGAAWNILALHEQAKRDKRLP
ncbi:hypothetical protein [Streptomyces sp. NRRL S-1868]|uniref:hypothetical protein n=1 Tax=Streptomyces sp. NRRL S-1868 TaxID=1463892 RepID=UPI0004CC1E69|nr:hypothetical protein [Streptomyces sp. NRRL S-1868]